MSSRTRSAAFLRAVLAGAASGSRSQCALAACAVSHSPTPYRRIDAWLHKPAVRRAQVVAAAGELIGDKLPQTPSRTSPPGLLPRVALGATAASVLAGRRGESQRLAAAIGALAAAATSFGGVRARAAWAARVGSDLPGALAEDALAVATAFTATCVP
ncbi:MAG: hypothetical protein QOF92_994 [Pseudonocardiales bacterium]|jgi:uncharacterized membrane protein|nr:hypothetical protein [Pseudonocardiales bacterium]